MSLARTLFTAALLMGVPRAVACKTDPPITRPEQAASAAVSAAPSMVAPPLASAATPKAVVTLDRFFPPDGTFGARRVFTTQTGAISEARVLQDGKEIAILSISDTGGTPGTRDGVAKPAERINGFPLTTAGTEHSMLLVKDRYQVKVSSKILDPRARKGWIARFDLNGLTAL